MAAPELDDLLANQRSSWERGDRVLVESLLDRHPGLKASDPSVLDLIYNEIILREEKGESPDFEEYAKRFPNFAPALRRQFEVHQAVTPRSRVFAGQAGAIPIEEPPPPLPGYESLRKLGRGGMGIVYRARQIKLNRDVAIKLLRDWSDADPKHLKLFLEEARAIAQLKHPNVVQIHDVGEAEGCPFLCLELVEGGSLDQKLRGKPQAARASAQMVETLARAVHYVHQRKIVHCDLKPANVLLDSVGDHAAGYGTPKISDFGFARLADGETARLSGDTGGTLCYMAPEQTGGRAKEIGPASDVHALARFSTRCSPAVRRSWGRPRPKSCARCCS